MTRPAAVTREQVIAYRVAEQGLHREAKSVAGLGVLDLGLQDAMGHAATLAVTARLAAPVTPAGLVVGPGHRLALAWSLRGAPHLHRRRELADVARALYPLSEADAATRLGESGPSLKRKGMTALEQFEIAVAAMRKVVRSSSPKGEASTAATKELPAAMRRQCRTCRTSHIADGTMRLAALLAGLELQPGTAPPVLVRTKGARPVTSSDPSAVGALAQAYLHYLGPATPADFASFLDARRADVEEHWPTDLTEVSIDGRTAYLPADRLRALRRAPAAKLVRLLGAFDPYLQARDRWLTVPDKTKHKTLWPVLGRPGVLLVDGEVAGVWRPKSSGSKLALTVEPFATITPAHWKQVDAEAERVAAARGAADVTVKHGGS